MVRDTKNNIRGIPFIRMMVAAATFLTSLPGEVFARDPSLVENSILPTARWAGGATIVAGPNQGSKLALKGPEGFSFEKEGKDNWISQSVRAQGVTPPPGFSTATVSVFGLVVAKILQGDKKAGLSRRGQVTASASCSFNIFLAQNSSWEGDVPDIVPITIKAAVFAEAQGGGSYPNNTDATARFMVYEGGRLLFRYVVQSGAGYIDPIRTLEGFEAAPLLEEEILSNEGDRKDPMNFPITVFPGQAYGINMSVGGTTDVTVFEGDSGSGDFFAFADPIFEFPDDGTDWGEIFELRVSSGFMGPDFSLEFVDANTARIRYYVGPNSTILQGTDDLMQWQDYTPVQQDESGYEQRMILINELDTFYRLKNDNFDITGG